MDQQRPRGTQDLYGTKVAVYRRLEQFLRTVSGFYGYGEVITPLFENRELFIRATGSTSDIAQKEMYDFKDRGDRWLSLRPEGTAGVVRAVVENKLLAEADLPLKLFYFGPMYRYERPQAGRYREFWQFGVECFGIANPQADVETITFAYQLLAQAARLKKFTLKLNCLGDDAAKGKWSKALTEYFSQHADQLSEDSRKRIDANPMRILDDKTDSKLEVVRKAPRLTSFLTEEAVKEFAQVCSALDRLNIKYELDQSLVRGLDYYTGTVFEFVSESLDSASQSTLIGGGRYDGLVEQLGGPKTPAVGFGLGVERMILSMEEEKVGITDEEGLDAYLVCVGTKAQTIAVNVATNLRMSGLKVEYDMTGRKIGAQFKSCARKNARFAVVIGDRELASETFTVKNQATQVEHGVKADDLVAYLKAGGKQ